MLNQLEQNMPVGSPNDASDGQQANYVVRLPAFEGPLDLLLHLIEKRQMEITTISLLAVTDQYLDYLRSWQDEQIPLANMAAFISIASRLLYIKSQSLLPHASKEELAGEMESAAVMAEELRAHLLEYKLAKEIALYLRHREEAGLQTHARSGLLAGIETQLTWSPPTLIGLEVDMLAQAFQRILALRARDEAANASFLPLARVRVSERITEIVSILRARPHLSLVELLENETSRLVIIVTFLAVLELWKHARITVRQNSLFSSILLERGERWEDNDQIPVEDEY
jgi:segregation and condensation protein A